MLRYVVGFTLECDSFPTLHWLSNGLHLNVILKFHFAPRSLVHNFFDLFGFFHLLVLL